MQRTITCCISASNHLGERSPQAGLIQGMLPRVGGGTEASSRAGTALSRRAWGWGKGVQCRATHLPHPPPHEHHLSHLSPTEQSCLVRSKVKSTCGVNLSSLDQPLYGAGNPAPAALGLSYLLGRGEERVVTAPFSEFLLRESTWK